MNALTRFGLLTMLTVGLAGCAQPVAAPAAQTQPATAATDAPQTGAKEKVTLSMWTHDPLYVKFFTARAEEWAKTHPEYEFTFDFQQVPDVFTKILANFASNQPVPDLIGLEQGQVATFMKDDIIEQKFVDLTDLIGADRDKFVEGRWAPYSYKGKLYGVESALCPVAYYFQPEIFDKYGIKPPTTWEDFLTVGETLAKDGVALAPVDIEGSMIFMQLFWQRGGQVFDQDGNFVFSEKANQDIALEVLNFLKLGLDKKVLAGFSGADFWGAPIFASYRSGKVAGVFMPDWYSDYMLKPQAEDMAGKWRIAPLPKWTNGGFASSTIGGTGFAITKESKHVDLAWDLLKYAYMTKENQVKRYEEIQYFPTMLDAINDSRVTGKTDPYYGDQVVGEVWSEMAKGMPVWYQSPARADFDTELGTQLTNFYAGKTTAEDALKRIVDVTNKAIASQ